MVDYPFLLQLAVSGAALIGAFAVAKWRVERAERELAKLTADFQDFRVVVAREYVTTTSFGNFALEMKTSIDRLSSRIDQALAKGRGD